MLSKEQEINIRKKVLTVTSEFINTGYSIENVSKITGISSSSVQRYLNDQKRIVSLLGKDVYDEIQKMLKHNKKECLSKGGYISTLKNEAIRSNDGKFSGNRKK